MTTDDHTDSPGMATGFDYLSVYSCSVIFESNL